MIKYYKMSKEVLLGGFIEATTRRTKTEYETLSRDEKVKFPYFVWIILV